MKRLKEMANMANYNCFPTGESMHSDTRGILNDKHVKHGIVCNKFEYTYFVAIN